MLWDNTGREYWLLECGHAISDTTYRGRSAERIKQRSCMLCRKHPPLLEAKEKGYLEAAMVQQALLEGKRQRAIAYFTERGQAAPAKLQAAFSRLALFEEASKVVPTPSDVQFYAPPKEEPTPPRPTLFAPDVRHDVAAALASEVIAWLGQGERETVIEELENAFGIRTWDAYKLARFLDDSGWQVDMGLVNILGRAKTLAIKVRLDLILQWVKDTKPQPAFKMGDHIVSTRHLDDIEGEIVGVDKTQAMYLVRQGTKLRSICFEDAMVLTSTTSLGA